MKLLKSLTKDNIFIKKTSKIFQEIDKLAGPMEKLTDDELKNKTNYFRAQLAEGKELDDILVEAFAVVREASRRILGLFPYKVQIIGAVAIHRGDVAEMKTGEGKTLTAIMPVYLNALTGEGVHVVTVNEYLAERDARMMGEVYLFLGLTVGVNLKDLGNPEKQKAYNADITYTVNSELGFDYLRDNMCKTKINQVQRGCHFAVIDEADSILIDEARTPLIISGGDTTPSELYISVDHFVKTLKKDEYKIDHESKSISLEHEGVLKAEQHFKLKHLFSMQHSELVHRIQNALRANYIMKYDIEYIVRDDEILLVDQFTGRVMEGRSYSEGLQQAIQAKEGVKIESETKTLATITYQNFFRMYKKLSGMTGTAKTEEEEFLKIYNMRVISIPTNEPIIRNDKSDVIFSNMNAKWKAVVAAIAEKHLEGQPILVGTSAVEFSEHLSVLLDAAKIKHQVLNAKNHLNEAQIIAKAGELFSVTIATNMAGRGTDIKLGKGVTDIGGLAVIGTERHEARRIDNQLRGRSGRQGDVGDSRFYISIDDSIMRRFTAYEKLKKIFASFKDEPIKSKIISRKITSAQKRIEGMNFDSRKNVLDYDDVIRQQREIMYSQRQAFIDNETVTNIIYSMLKSVTEDIINLPFLIDSEGNVVKSKLVIALNKSHFSNYDDKIALDEIENKDNNAIKKYVFEKLKNNYINKKSELEDAYNSFEKTLSLQVFDQNWQKHIDELDKLKHGIYLRSYAQKNPLQVYVEEADKLFIELKRKIAHNTVRIIMNANLENKATNDDADIQNQEVIAQPAIAPAPAPAPRKIITFIAGRVLLF